MSVGATALPSLSTAIPSSCANWYELQPGRGVPRVALPGPDLAVLAGALAQQDVAILQS